MDTFVKILNIFNPIGYAIVSWLWFLCWHKTTKKHFELERRIRTVEMWARLNDLKINPPTHGIDNGYWDQPWNNQHKEKNETN